MIPHPSSTIFTAGLPTTSAWFKNILCVIKDMGSDWFRAGTCDRCQPIERTEDNGDLVTCIIAAVCVVFISAVKASVPGSQDFG